MGFSFNPFTGIAPDNANIPLSTGNISNEGSFLNNEGSTTSVTPEGGDNTTPTEPTLDEQLQNLQLDESNFNAMMRPYMAGQAGLVVQDDGTLRPMTQQELYGTSAEDKTGVSQYSPYADETARTNYWLNYANQQKQLGYARGEGETPASILNSLKEQRNTETGLVRQRLGAKGAVLSTPGVGSMSNIAANEIGVKSAYAHGNEAQGLGLLGQGYQNIYNNANAWNSNLNNLFTGGSGLPGMSAQVQQPQLAQNNLNSLQSSLYQQNQNAISGGLLSGIGTAASLYLTKGMGGR